MLAVALFKTWAKLSSAHQEYVALEATAITQAIRHRRTVKPKLFSDRDIDEALIETILENANWAPTHGMTEPWRFRIFVGPARQRLAQFLAQTYKDLTPKDQFKPAKFEGMSRNAMLAPAVVAIGMHRQRSGKITELDEIMAVACAVQNMQLTAAAHGLGAFWSTNVAATSAPMTQFIGLESEDRALGLLYLGYPAGQWPTSQRTAIEEKIQWIRE